MGCLKYIFMKHKKDNKVVHLKVEKMERVKRNQKSIEKLISSMSFNFINLTALRAYWYVRLFIKIVKITLLEQGDA